MVAAVGRLDVDIVQLADRVDVLERRQAPGKRIVIDAAPRGVAMGGRRERCAQQCAGLPEKPSTRR